MAYAPALPRDVLLRGIVAAGASPDVVFCPEPRVSLMRVEHTEVNTSRASHGVICIAVRHRQSRVHPSIVRELFAPFPCRKHLRVSSLKPVRSTAGFDFPGYRTVSHDSDARNYQNGTPLPWQDRHTDRSSPRRGSAARRNSFPWTTWEPECLDPHPLPGGRVWLPLEAIGQILCSMKGIAIWSSRSIAPARKQNGELSIVK